jgi:hypothetical protein
MPEVIPQGFGRLAHKFRLAGDNEPMFVTCGWGAEGAIADLYDTARQMHDAMKSVHVQRGSAAYTLQETTVYYRASADPSPQVATFAAPWVGGNAGDAFPSNTAFLLKKITAKGGRRHQGRMFYPGVNEGNVDSLGQVGASIVTSFNTLLATYIVNIEAIAGVLGLFILHSQPQNLLIDDPTRITQIMCDGRVATQRQRLRR